MFPSQFEKTLRASNKTKPNEHQQFLEIQRRQREIRKKQREVQVAKSVIYRATSRYLLKKRLEERWLRELKERIFKISVLKSEKDLNDFANAILQCFAEDSEENSNSMTKFFSLFSKYHSQTLALKDFIHLFRLFSAVDLCDASWKESLYCFSFLCSFIKQSPQLYISALGSTAISFYLSFLKSFVRMFSCLEKYKQFSLVLPLLDWIFSKTPSDFCLASVSSVEYSSSLNSLLFDNNKLAIQFLLNCINLRKQNIISNNKNLALYSKSVSSFKELSLSLAPLPQLFQYSTLPFPFFCDIIKGIDALLRDYAILGQNTSLPLLKFNSFCDYYNFRFSQINPSAAKTYLRTSNKPSPSACCLFNIVGWFAKVQCNASDPIVKPFLNCVAAFLPCLYLVYDSDYSITKSDGRFRMFESDSDDDDEHVLPPSNVGNSFSFDQSLKLFENNDQNTGGVSNKVHKSVSISDTSNQLSKYNPVQKWSQIPQNVAYFKENWSFLMHFCFKLFPSSQHVQKLKKKYQMSLRSPSPNRIAKSSIKHSKLDDTQLFGNLLSNQPKIQSENIDFFSRTRPTPSSENSDSSSRLGSLFTMSGSVNNLISEIVNNQNLPIDLRQALELLPRPPLSIIQLLQAEMWDDARALFPTEIMEQANLAAQVELFSKSPQTASSTPEIQPRLLSDVSILDLDDEIKSLCPLPPILVHRLKESPDNKTPNMSKDPVPSLTSSSVPQSKTTTLFEIIDWELLYPLSSILSFSMKPTTYSSSFPACTFIPAVFETGLNHFRSFLVSKVDFLNQVLELCSFIGFSHIFGAQTNIPKYPLFQNSTFDWGFEPLSYLFLGIFSQSISLWTDFQLSYSSIFPYLPFIVTSLKVFSFQLIWKDITTKNPQFSPFGSYTIKDQHISKHPIFRLSTKLLYQLAERNARRKFISPEYWQVDKVSNISFVTRYLSEGSTIEGPVMETDDPYSSNPFATSTESSPSSSTTSNSFDGNPFDGNPFDVNPFSTNPFDQSTSLKPKPSSTRSSSIRTNNTSSLGRAHSVISLIPFVISFKTRVSLLQRMIHKRFNTSVSMFHKHGIKIRRNRLLQDSVDELLKIPSSQLRTGLKVVFIDEFGKLEKGIDGGGLFKEWITSVCEKGFYGDHGLFTTTPAGLLYPTPTIFKVQSAHKEILNTYLVLGKIVALAIIQGILIPSRFSEFFLSKMLKKPIDINHYSNFDPEHFVGLRKLLEMENVEESFGINFCTHQKILGQVQEIELINNGKNIVVTDSNKHLYVRALVDYQLNRSIRRQTQSFLTGMASVLPVDWIRMFSESELQLLISGNNVIDWEDLRQNVQYSGYSDDEPYIQTFWKLVKQFDSTQSTNFFKFSTGAGAGPLLGFHYLSPKFTIMKDDGDANKLPTAATCFNKLRLPFYGNTEKGFQLLKEKLTYAIQFSEGFEMS